MSEPMRQANDALRNRVEERETQIRDLKDAIERQRSAFEYLVSMLPEECTAGFVTHARAIASGDPKRIEETR